VKRSIISSSPKPDIYSSSMDEKTARTGIEIRTGRKRKTCVVDLGETINDDITGT
jgi:hypothetical protein